MRCQRCGLVNPPTALKCDCGWPFGLPELKKGKIPRRKKFGVVVVIGLIACGIAFGPWAVVGWIVLCALIAGIAMLFFGS